MEKSSPTLEKQHSSVFNDLPEAKRRKFILVDDTEHKTRVRVKVNLESVEIAEIPGSYRRDNSVYLRSWDPTEIPESPHTQRARRIRFVDDDEEDGAKEGVGVRGGGMHVGRVTVPVPMVDAEGKEGVLRVPGLGRRAKEKEEKLNDLGYRMCWGQGRVFAGRLVFLQKSREFFHFSLLLLLLLLLLQNHNTCSRHRFILFGAPDQANRASFSFGAVDVYRNKAGSTIAARGQEISTVAPHLETRIGKKMWLERKKNKRTPSRET